MGEELQIRKFCLWIAQTRLRKWEPDRASGVLITCSVTLDEHFDHFEMNWWLTREQGTGKKRIGTQSRRKRSVTRSLLLSVCWANDASCRFPTITLELRDPAFHEQPAEITDPYPLYFCPKDSEYSTGRACSKAQGPALAQYREELHPHTLTVPWKYTGHLKTPRTVSREDFINKIKQVKFPPVQ